MSNDANSLRRHSPTYVISAGTQVVLKVSKKQHDDDTFRKAGAVGVIVACPKRADGQYLVEFTDGTTTEAQFEELALRREEIDLQLAKSSGDLRDFVILRCRVGSRAFGLSTIDSDDDIRGVFLPSAKLHWSLYSVPEQIEQQDGAVDEVFWELEKFLKLCLKANPNVLEVLWSPLVLEASNIARQLLEIRTAFLSKHLYKTYSGYVLSQFRRMKKSVEKNNDYKSKHAMHLIRLLHSGIHAMRTGEILIDVGEHREQLLNIRRGSLSFEQVERMALALDSEFQLAYEKTTLPEQPDFQCVDAFLVDARRSMV